MPGVDSAIWVTTDSGWLPGQEGWLHRDLATALAAQARDLETVLPAALGLATLSRTLSYGQELGPFVAAIVVSAAVS
jgi:hypothetical protein